MKHETYARLHEALDKLIKLEASPELAASSYLRVAVYSIETSITAALDAEKIEVPRG